MVFGKSRSFFRERYDKRRKTLETINFFVVFEKSVFRSICQKSFRKIHGRLDFEKIDWSGHYRTFSKPSYTALTTKKIMEIKILFTPSTITDYDLQRNEVVALFNGFGRLSHSIVFLERFQRMALDAGETPVRKIKNPFFLKPEL